MSPQPCAFQSLLRPPAVWSRSLAGLWIAAAASLIAWLVLAELPLPLALTAGAASAAALALAAPLLRPAPCLLRCDGADWWWSPASGAPALRGQLQVALDLGSLLLLRFDPAGRARGRRWIPVATGGAQAGWHALRRAVYCAPLHAGHSASGDAPGSVPFRHDLPNERR